MLSFSMGTVESLLVGVFVCSGISVKNDLMSFGSLESWNVFILIGTWL